MQAYHPVIDERALIPKQVNMIQRIYGISSDLDSSSRDCLLDSWMNNYSDLQNIFYNLDDNERSIIGTNCPQIDELVKDYLIYKGILQAPRNDQINSSRTDGSAENFESQKANAALRKGQNYMSEYLLATVEVLSFKIEAAHMQRVLMGWISGEGKIPSTTQDYTALIRKYQDMTTLKILEERQHLNDIYFSGEKPNKEETKSKGKNVKDKAEEEMKKRDRQVMLEPEKRKTANLRFFDKINEIRAETNVIKQLLDQKLIQIAVRMITNEHSALSAAIDFAGSQETIQEYVHP